MSNESKDTYFDDISTINEQFFERSFDVDWLIPNLIEKNNVSVLYGKNETYKSFLALHIGWCLAHGHSVLKSNQEPLEVFYFAFENPEQHGRRLLALKQEYPMKVSEDAGFHLCNEQFKLGEKSFEAKAKLKYLNWVDVIIFDTLSYLYPDGDESKGHIARQVMHWLGEFAEKHKVTIICIHHPIKSDNQEIRGSSEINNAVNTIIHNNGTQLRVKKQRNGKSGQRYDYVMNYVEKFDTLIPEFTNSRKKHDVKIESLLTIIESKPDSIISRTELREEWLKVHGVENQSTNNTNFSRALKKAVSDGLIKIETGNEDEIVSINEV